MSGKKRRPGKKRGGKTQHDVGEYWVLRKERQGVRAERQHGQRPDVVLGRESKHAERVGGRAALGDGLDLRAMGQRERMADRSIRAGQGRVDSDGRLSRSGFGRLLRQLEREAYAVDAPSRTFGADGHESHREPWTRERWNADAERQDAAAWKAAREHRERMALYAVADGRFLGWGGDAADMEGLRVAAAAELGWNTNTNEGNES